MTPVGVTPPPYSTASVPSKPFVLWLPSHNGFLLELPQRQSAYGLPSGVATGLPSLSHKVISPSIHSGPFSRILIIGLDNVFLLGWR